MSTLLIVLVSLLQPNAAIEKPYLEIEVYSKNVDVLQVLYKDSTEVKGVHAGYHGFIFAGLDANSTNTIKVSFDTINSLVGLRFAFGILRSNEIKIFNITINDGRRVRNYSASSLKGELIYNQNISQIQISSNFIGFKAEKEGGIFLNNLLRKANKSHFMELECRYNKSDLMVLRYTNEDGASESQYRHVAAGDFQQLRWEISGTSRITNFTIDIFRNGNATKLDASFLKYFYFDKEMIWNSSNWDRFDCLDCIMVSSGNKVMIKPDSTNEIHHSAIYSKNRIYFGNEKLIQNLYTIAGFIVVIIILIPFNKMMITENRIN